MSGEEMRRSIASTSRFRSWAATHPGTVRARNEDAFVNRPDLGLWAVADGAGGHEDGAAAARTVTEALEAIPPGLPAGAILAEVRARIEAAHAALREEAARRGGAMLASTVVVLLARDDHYACLWAGDSRAYRLHDGRMEQVTRDHSLVQELLDSGAITTEEAGRHPRANVITRAVGAGEDGGGLDKVSGRIAGGDRLLLCSDGLTKALTPEEAAELLACDEDSPAERLVLAALARRAEDNVTSVAVQVLAGEAEQTIQLRPPD